MRKIDRRTSSGMSARSTQQTPVPMPIASGQSERSAQTKGAAWSKHDSGFVCCADLTALTAR